MERSSGILLHIATLPGEYGIGQLGKEAREFIDYLAEAGQSYWQVLPLVPTGYGDSPYQSCCSYAGNEYFIDLNGLAERGLLTEEELREARTPLSSRIDYEHLFLTRTTLLRKAYNRLQNDKKFQSFLKKGEFFDYAMFKAIKAEQNYRAWNEWEDKYKFRDEATLKEFEETHKEDLKFYQWLQYEFFNEWNSLREYAKKKGIGIIGDIPIYIAYDGVECWTNHELVKLGEDLNPTVVAGCPPDAFCDTGQLWGNPVYDWSRHKADNYTWWKQRIAKCFSMYDVVRVDHFRGFDKYYEIPFGDKTAVGGWWADGPSCELFEELEKTFGKMEVIAEDLGDLDDSAREMFKKVGYPGMKIMQFAFESGEGNEYLPHNYKNDNCIVYTGTHDNDTLMGFISKLGDNKEIFINAVKTEMKAMEFDKDVHSDEDLADSIIELSQMSMAKLAVAPMQDWLKIGAEGRINMPSTLSTENWSYRIPHNYREIKAPQEIYKLTKKYARI